MNAPGTFQAFVNDVLRDFLDDFVVVYLDDILIYSENPEEHTAHVKKVLQRLEAAGISLKLEKCAFDQEEVHFLGFVIGVNGISMDPAKVAAIKEWATPKTVLEIQIFLGLANFYRRFVKNYSKIAAPLTALLKKNAKFVWSAAAQEAFEELKSRLMSGPILRHYDHTKACVIEPDASDYALGAICSQYGEDGLLHPVAYYSRKLLPAEMNYQIYDKELLAIVCAFKHWRHYLEFSASATEVLTDHRNLEYFTTTRHLSRRQVRWSEVLSDYNFIIKYRPGSLNGAADALSRRDKPEGGGTAPLDKTAMTLLPPIQFLNNIQVLPLLPEDPDIQDKIRALLPDDPIFGPILLKNTDTQDPESPYSVQDGLLLREGLVCVPDNQELKKMILQECHDSPMLGFPRPLTSFHEPSTGPVCKPTSRTMLVAVISASVASQATTSPMVFSSRCPSLTALGHPYLWTLSPTSQNPWVLVLSVFLWIGSQKWLILHPQQTMWMQKAQCSYS